ncbi:hypothetical protein [Massilia violaceinigra]|uniref:hypothetical protein n=1 Tax=Massilia violaceinigra TaxID=2045208 RepID=UPI001ABFE087|nr:hypothetical protein [Massilia violaceinigra]
MTQKNITPGFSPLRKSAETKEKIREKALRQGAQRTLDIVSRTRAALKSIGHEIDSSNGVYPQNGGTLSLAEVARRADVHITTYFSHRHKVLREEVNIWLAHRKSAMSASPRKSSRGPDERMNDWKTMYAGLAQSHRDTELELLTVRAELTSLRAELEVLRSESKMHIVARN